MILWSLSYRLLRLRLGRTAPAILAVAISVLTASAVCYCAIIADRYVEALRRFKPVAADLELRAVGRPGLQEAAAQVSEVPGVASVVGALEKWTVASRDDRRSVAEVIGFDDEEYLPVHSLAIVDGRKCDADDELLIERGLATELKSSVGDYVYLRTPASLSAVKRRVAGIVERGGNVRKQGGRLLLMPMPQMKRLWPKSDDLSAAFVVFDDSRSVDEVTRSVLAGLPPHVTAAPPAGYLGPEEDVFRIVTLSLISSGILCFAAATLIVGGILLINVSERAATFAQLAAAGAEPHQVRGLMLRDGVFVAVPGLAVGAILSVPALFLARAALELLVGEPVEQDFPWSILLSAGVAMATLVVAAALVPALLFVERVRRFESSVRAEAQHRRVGGTAARYGIATTAAGSLLFAASLLLRSSGALTVAGFALVIIGWCLLLPATLPRMLGCCERFGRGTRGYTRLLLLRQSEHSPVSTAMVTGVAMSLLTISIGFGGTTLDVLTDVEAWRRDALPIDYLVQSKIAKLDLAASDPLPPEVETTLAASPDVEFVDRVNFLRTQVDGRRATLILRDFEKYPAFPGRVLAADGDPAQAASDGRLVCGAIFAAQLGIGVGDEVEIEVDGIRARRKVGCITADYAAGGAVVCLERKASPWTPKSPPQSLLLKARSGSGPALRQTLDELASRHGTVFQSVEQFGEQVNSMLSGIVGGLCCLLGFVLILMGFGIATVFGVLVIEQRRAIGVLQLVGMTSAQVRGLIRRQGVWLYALGAVQAVPLGVLLAYLMNRAANEHMGYGAAYRLHPAFIASVLAVGLLISVIAVAVPAANVARTSPVRVLEAY